MARLFIRKAGQNPVEIDKNQIVPAIKVGKLDAEDEISADGKSWISLGAHKQLGTLFNKEPAGAPATPVPPPAPAKPRKMTEREFYSSDRVFCPKCGFEQDRGPSCEKCDIIFEKYWEIKSGGSRRKAEPEVEQTQPAGGSGNFLKTLWNGEYPLWVTFWIFGFVIPAGIWFLFQTFIFAPNMEHMMTQNPSREMMMETMRSNFRNMTLMAMVMYCYQFIVSVGLWRSAGFYQGFGLWRVLVQILVVLYFISIPGTIYSYINAWDMMEQGLEQMDMMMQMQQNQIQQNPMGQP